MAMEPLWRPVWVWPTLIAYLPGFASAFIVVWGYNYTCTFSVTIFTQLLR